MDVRLANARYYAVAIAARAEARRSYEAAPEEQRTAIMLDLVGSSAHRLVRGSRDAYERTLVFYTLTLQIFGVAPSIQIIKEMGDGILAVATNARDAFDACLILKSVERVVANEFVDNLFPFRIRTGLGFGPLKRVLGVRQDFLGSAIDELARITSDKRFDDGILVSKDFKDVIDSHGRWPYDFARLGTMQVWSDSQAKRVVQREIEYYPVEIDFQAMTIAGLFERWGSRLADRP